MTAVTENRFFAKRKRRAKVKEGGVKPIGRPVWLLGVAHIERLRTIGFDEVYPYFRCFNFASYLAIKA